MQNYEAIIAAFVRGRKEGIEEVEKEIIKARQESYLKGFRDGKDYAFGEVRSVLDGE
jgi:hypothetical protein